MTEPLTPAEEVKFRESVALLAPVDSDLDLGPQWTNTAAQRLLATLDRDRIERDKLRMAIRNAIDNIAHSRYGHAIRQLRAARSLFE